VPTKGQENRSKLLGLAGLEGGPSPDYYTRFYVFGSHYILRLYKLKPLRPSPIYSVADSQYFLFSEKIFPRFAIAEEEEGGGGVP